jgi:hypothetical protein
MQIYREEKTEPLRDNIFLMGPAEKERGQSTEKNI